MMSWMKAGIISLISGLVAGLLVTFVLSKSGDCGIASMASAILFGVPLGNVTAIGFYRIALNLLSNADIAGVILALIFSGFAAFLGISSMDHIGAPGLLIALFSSCLGSLFGYAIGLKMMKSISTH